MDKDEMVKQEVVEMGDNDYVCRSERARQEGRMAEVYSSVQEGDYGIKRGAEKLGL